MKLSKNMHKICLIIMKSDQNDKPFPIVISFIFPDGYYIVRGHSKTTLTIFGPFFTTYLPPVDMFTK